MLRWQVQRLRFGGWWPLNFRAEELSSWSHLECVCITFTPNLIAIMYVQRLCPCQTTESDQNIIHPSITWHSYMGALKRALMKSCLPLTYLQQRAKEEEEEARYLYTHPINLFYAFRWFVYSPLWWLPNYGIVDLSYLYSNLSPPNTPRK